MVDSYLFSSSEPSILLWGASLIYAVSSRDHKETDIKQENGAAQTALRMWMCAEDKRGKGLPKVPPVTRLSPGPTQGPTNKKTVSRVHQKANLSESCLHGLVKFAPKPHQKLDNNSWITQLLWLSLSEFLYEYHSESGEMDSQCTFDLFFFYG
jgi:hypothetical protein